MDKVSQYQQIVIDYLREFESFGTPSNGLENQLLIDREEHHYQYIIKGWQQNRHFVYTGSSLNVIFLRV